MMIRSVMASRKGEEFSALGMVHLLCMTPDMFRFYLKAADGKLVDEVVTDRGDEIWFEECSEEFFAAVKTALVVEAWANEVPEDMIAEQFGVGAGDIHAAVENLKWLLHAGSRIAHEFVPEFEEGMKILEIRAANGVREELIPLISLKGIGRVRARRLFARGIRTPEELIAANRADVVAILGAGVAESVLAAAGRKRKRGEGKADTVEERIKEVREEVNIEAKERKVVTQPTLFDFGG